MSRARHIGAGVAILAVAIAVAVEPGRAHKPITSPFTYNEDVFPILRDRCARCHVPEGVAPMSLMTYEDTVPWGESIRVELLAGHMPPWSVDAAPARFRNAQPLSAREMNVLLTWATGGTPFGNPDKTPQPVTYERRWPLGNPDLELPLPTEFTLAAGKQEDIAEFVVPTRFTERRWLRAVDLAPGTPAIVRSATVQIRSATPADPSQGTGTDSLLALWLPGDEPVAVNGGAAFDVPAGAELLVRVRYKKTWQYERKELSDRSTIGLYFAKDASQPVRAIALLHDGPALRDEWVAAAVQRCASRECSRARDLSGQRPIRRQCRRDRCGAQRLATRADRLSPATGVGQAVLVSGTDSTRTRHAIRVNDQRR